MNYLFYGILGLMVFLIAFQLITGKGFFDAIGVTENTAWLKWVWGAVMVLVGFYLFGGFSLLGIG